MKNLFLLLTASLALSSCVSLEMTPKNLLSDPIYSRVVDVPDADSATLLKRAKIFVADTYNSSRDVITFQDDSRINGTAIGMGRASGDIMDRGFRYNFLIQVKDGRARLSISSVTEERTPSSISSGLAAGLDPTWRAHYDAIISRVEILADRFESAVKNASSKENW